MGRGESPIRRRRSRSPRVRRTYSRSPKRYRSRSPREFGSRFSRSRYYDGRERPDPNPCLGVFGMSLHTSERDLKKIFGQFGDIESVQLVYDRYSGRSRGFGFVYFTKTRDATRAKEHLRDAVIDGMKVRVDYSVTRNGVAFRHGRYSPAPRRYRSRSRSSRRLSHSGERLRSRTYSSGSRSRSTSRTSRLSPASVVRRSTSYGSPRQLNNCNRSRSRSSSVTLRDAPRRRSNNYNRSRSRSVSAALRGSSPELNNRNQSRSSSEVSYRNPTYKRSPASR